MEKIHFNQDDNRFEYTVDGQIAFIEYKRDGAVFKLVHTEVPESLGGRGVGKKLVALTLQYLKENDFQLVPLCPFVAAFLKRNPEWNTLLANRK